VNFFSRPTFMAITVVINTSVLMALRCSRRFCTKYQCLLRSWTNVSAANQGRRVGICRSTACRQSTSPIWRYGVFSIRHETKPAEGWTLRDTAVDWEFEYPPLWIKTRVRPVKYDESAKSSSEKRLDNASTMPVDLQPRISDSCQLQHCYPMTWILD